MNIKISEDELKQFMNEILDEVFSEFGLPPMSAKSLKNQNLSLNRLCESQTIIPNRIGSHESHQDFVEEGGPNDA